MFTVTYDKIAETQILTDLRDGVYLFDFSHQPQLANDLLSASVQQILFSASLQQDPDGRHFAPLGRFYAAWKQKHFPGQPIGRLIGRMLSPNNVDGKRTVTPTRASIDYGREMIAIHTAIAFQEGAAATGHRSQPERHFFYIGTRVAAAADRILTDHMNQWAA